MISRPGADPIFRFNVVEKSQYALSFQFIQAEFFRRNIVRFLTVPDELNERVPITCNGVFAGVPLYG